MSEIIVAVTTIDAVKPHPNADRLEIAIIKGWQVVVSKGTYRDGDRVIYVPPDAIVPTEWSDRWGVTQYLSNGRVRCARLRGEPSFGFTAPVADLPSDAPDETNVAEIFGITKYEPPVRETAGDAAPHHPLFVQYTEIENLRHFPDVLLPGEQVIVTEKIHGSSCRAGVIEGEMMAGSHRVRRKRPEGNLKASTYWFPLTVPGVEALLAELGAQHKQVLLFGEVYGRVQSLRYGLGQALAFRAFDLLVDGNYLDVDAFAEHCERHGIPVVPVLYRGPYVPDEIPALAQGTTTIGGDHIREGVVVRPVHERHDEKVGRVIVKYVSDDFMLSGKDTGGH